MCRKVELLDKRMMLGVVVTQIVPQMMQFQQLHQHQIEVDTLEINRLCTDGTPNACSILYAAAYRAARAMGYTKVVTYILDTESGVSLKAAGYVCEGRAGGLEWNGERKPKMANQYPYQMKTRWVKKIEKEGMNGR